MGMRGWWGLVFVLLCVAVVGSPVVAQVNGTTFEAGPNGGDLVDSYPDDGPANGVSVGACDIPSPAINPSPVDGGIDVAVDAELSWNGSTSQSLATSGLEDVPGIGDSSSPGTTVAGEIELQIASVPAGVGDLVAVPVQLRTNSTAPSTIFFSLTFDSTKLRVDNVAAGAAATNAGKVLNWLSTQPGTIVIVFSGGTSVMSDGTLAIPAFEVLPTVSQDEVLPITGLNPSASDSSAISIPIVVTTGAITVGTVCSEVYDVYLDTVNPPTMLVASDIITSSFTPGMLDEETTYYWKVVARNSEGETSGPVWSFTTADSSGCSMPVEPNDPSPVDGELDVARYVTFSWSNAGAPASVAALSKEVTHDDPNTIVPASPFRALANSSLFTTDDNQDNHGTGMPDNDMDVWLYNSDPEAPIEFDILYDGEPAPANVQLLLRIWDVDETSGEQDGVFFNGVRVGTLTGANDEWSTTVLNINPALLHVGNNLVRVDIDELNVSSWAVTVDWGQLVVDGTGGTASIRYALTNSNLYQQGDTVVGTVEVDTSATSQNVLVETNILDSYGVNIAGTSRSYTVFGDGDDPFDTFLGLPVDAPDGVYSFQVLVYDSDTAMLEDQRTVPFTVGNPCASTWDVYLDGTLLFSDITAPQCTVGPLNYETQYEWQVVAKNLAGETVGPVWSFVTAPPPPVASFEAQPLSGCAPLDVQFTDTSTDTPNSWLWDFGDNSTSTAQHPTHTYTEAGIYTVQLHVENGGGTSDYEEVDYIIVSETPVASFTADVTSGVLPLDVQFTDNSTGVPTSWLWDFGDGSTSTDQHPSHVYTDPGTYTVSLSVSNDCDNDSIEEIDYIVATEPGELVVTLNKNLDAVLYPEAQSTVTGAITLANVGAGPVEWVLDEAGLSPSSVAAYVSGPPAVYVSDTLKLQEGEAQDSGEATVASQGGPDSGGYIYKDSNEPDGPEFNWLEVTTTGVNLNLTDDSHYFPIDLPFSFEFYGTWYPQIAVCSNGTVHFQNTYMDYMNDCMPTASASVEAFIALYWDDLYPSGANNVYYDVVGNAPDRILVVQFQNVEHYISADAITAQVQLHERDNRITLLYLDPSAKAGTSATVGIQGDSTTGLQYSCNSAVLESGLAIEFSRTCPWLDETPTVGRLDPGQSIDIDLTYSAVGLTDGFYDETWLSVTSDARTINQSDIPVSLTVQQDALQVTPQNAFEITGPPGGPFAPVQTRYTLTNASVTAVVWAATPELGNWISVTPSSGMLVAGASTEVQVDLLNAANALLHGTYDDTVLITNASSGRVQQRAVRLDVVGTPNLVVQPQSLDFVMPSEISETQVLSLQNTGTAPVDWTLAETTTGATATFVSAKTRPAFVMPAAAARAKPVDWSVDHVPGSLLVRFNDSAAKSAATRANVHAAMGTRKVKAFRLMALDLVEAPYGADLRALAQAYSARPEVAYAEPNYIVSADLIPTDPYFPELWGMHNTGQINGHVDADIDMPEAWDIQTGSHDVIVGVIDTGVDYTHPDLAANMWTNEPELNGTPGVDDDANGIVDDIYGACWTDDNGVATSGDPMDDHFHGTHVAGTIGALPNNGQGVVGVCHSVRIMALKFLNSSGSGSTSDAIAALEYAVDKGANLTNNSWGGGGYSQALKDAIDAAHAAGQLFVAAAGNEDSDNDVLPHYPSNYESPNIIAVANSDFSDEKDDMSCWGLTSVDLAAPGALIYSTIPGNSYDYLSGTSMATPHVSGVAALLLSEAPGTDPLTVKQWILDTVDPIAAFDPAGPTPVLTGGRLNAAKALQNAGVMWLDESPRSGTLAPGAPATLINVTASTVGLTHGFTDEVTLAFSDDTGALLQVPVTLNVTDPIGIVHQPLSDTNQAGPYSILADVTATAGLVRIELNYSLNGGATFVTVPMLPVSGDTFSASIPDLPIGTECSYYIEVEDAAGSLRGHPATAPAVLHTFLRMGIPNLVVSPANLDFVLESGNAETQSILLENTGNWPLEWVLTESQGSTPTYVAVNSPAVAGGVTTSTNAYVPEGTLVNARPSTESIVTNPHLLSSAVDVLFVTSGEAISVLTGSLASFPDIANLDVFDASTGVPLLTELQAYDVVIVMSASTLADSQALGNVLADYVDADGSVIQAVASFATGGAWELEGRFVAEGYGPFIHGGGEFMPHALGDFDATHDIMAGINIIFDGLPAAVGLRPTAQWVADWDNGTPLVATMGERVVAMNLHPFDDGDWNGAVPLLFHNAIVWVTGDWLAESPAVGTLAAGESQTVDVTADATGQPGGFQASKILTITGDPDGESQVPVTLTVLQPTPPIIAAVSDDAVDDGVPYVGPTPTLVQGSLPITWSLVTGPASMTIDPSTGVVNWSSVVYAGSPHTVTIRATNVGGSDDESWQLTVNPIAPVIAPIGNASVNDGAPYTGPTPSLIQGSLPVTWSLVTAPAGMSISANGVVNWPAASLSGSPHTVTIRAANAAGSDIETWQLTVNPVLPVIASINNANVNDGAPYTGPTPSLVQGSVPVTWSLVTGPVGMTINANGVVNWPTASLPGSPHTVTIRATNVAGSDTETWQLSVSAIAPVIAPIGNASVTDGSPYTGPTPSLTAGSVPVTWSLVTAPAGMTIDSNGVVTWSSASLPGSPHTVTIRATNVAGSDTESWQLTVNPIVPVIAPIGNANVEDGSPYTGPTPSLTAGSVPVTWSLVTAPAGMTIDANGVVTWSSASLPGSPHTVTIRATNAGGSDTESWQLTVNAITPVIDAIVNASVDDGSPYTGPTPSLTAGSVPVTWSLVTAPAGMTIDANGVVNWSSVSLSGSPHTVTIRATNDGGSDEESWQVTVNPVAPLIDSIADASVDDGAAYTGPTPSLSTGSLPVTWSLVLGPLGMTIDESTGVVDWSQAALRGSPHTVTIKVTNVSGTDYESWLLTVNASAPVIAPIGAASANDGAVYTGPTPSLSAGSLPVTWSLVEGPAGMTMDANGVVNWSPATMSGSPHTVTIRATNSVGSDEMTWPLTVNASTPVIAPIGNTSIDEGAAYTGPTPSLSAGTTPVTWSLVTGPAGMTIDADGVVNWPAATLSGSPHTVTIRATNVTGSDDETWRITVNAITPVISPLGNASVDEGSAYTGPTPTLSSGSTPVTWSLVTGPAGMLIDANGVVSWTSAELSGSPHTVTIRATNAAGSDDETWQLTVLAAPNNAPNAEAGGDQVVGVDELVMLDGSRSSDADNDTLTYRWAFVSKPQNSVAAIAQADTDAPSFSPDMAGQYVIELIVNDGTVDSQPDTVTVTATLCAASDVSIAFPPDGAHLIIPPGRQEVSLTVFAETSCPDDTMQVEYFMDAQPSGGVTEQPYVVTYQDLMALGEGEHTLTACVTSATTGDVAAEDTVTFTVYQIPPGHDTDGNGLPDNAFLALPAHGDVWLGSMQYPATGRNRNISLTRWLAIGGPQKTSADNTLTAIVDNKDVPGQRVIVQVPGTALQAGETAILVVQTASDLETLLGTEGAAVLSDEPITGLVPGGHYVTVNVLVSADEGLTFHELPPERLKDEPIHVIMEGVAIPVEGNPCFYVYTAAGLESDATSGLYMLVSDGEWTSGADCTLGVESYKIEMDSTATGLLAPFGNPDVDGNNAVTAVDVQLVINRALNLNIGDIKADIDCQEGVTAVDVQLVINAVLNMN